LVLLAGGAAPLAEEAELPFGIGGMGALDELTDEVARPGREGGEVGAQLGVQGARRDLGDERGQDAAQGEEDEEGVVHAGLDGMQDLAEVDGQAVRVIDDAPGEVVELGGGEGVAVRTRTQGVEVPCRRASTTRAEFCVAVDTA
jgi:hypothetical protein